MQRLIYYGMLGFMVIWTAVLVADLAEVLLSTGILDSPPPEGAAAAQAEHAYRTLSAGLWGAEAQARAIVWGLPMIVFAMLAALSRP